jgi:Flp pilus assembly protein TadG
VTPRELVQALAGSRSGTAAIEFAFVAPVLILFIFGTMEIGRVLWLQNALNYSVVEAARCLSNNPSQCGDEPGQAEGFAASRAGAGFTASVFTVTSASCGNQVSASYPVVFVIPFMNLSATLTAQACYPV